jgi:hypothetical protein
MKDAWPGSTVVCMASGPSLTVEDAELVREWGGRVIVTNTTCRMAPWADALVAWDGKWWDQHSEDVAAFRGLKFGMHSSVAKHGATVLRHPFNGYGNSGAAAISLALWAGAAKVVLLGYDCQRVNGEAHWHGAHPKGLSDAASIADWPRRFAKVARVAEGRVVNCSRSTILTCFPTGELRDHL